MGNIFQCCHSLSINLWQTVPHEEVESSPLLSSKDSECDSLCQSDDLEDDLLTISAGVANFALEPENFLYPDIILSSTLSDEVTLVEPMVCLLVSEEAEAGLRFNERRDEDGDRSGAGFLEVETQTDCGMQIEVQTQTMAQGEILTDESKTVQSEENILTEAVRPETMDVDECKLHVILKERDVLSETQASQEVTVKPEQKKISHFLSLDLISEHELSSMAQDRQNITGDRNHRSGESHVNSNIRQADEQLDDGTSPRPGKSQEPTDRRCSTSQPEPRTDQTTEEPVVQGTSQLTKPEGTSHHCKRTDLRQDSVCETSRLERRVEEGAQSTRTMYLLDRLFPTAPQTQAHHQSSGEDLSEESGFNGEPHNITDIIDLQEASFSVRIQPPGAESFEIQVPCQMLVAELQQVLMDHELTCHHTCFTLQVGSITLDNLTDLSSIQGIEDGILIKVVEDVYTVRDARLHIKHLRDLLRSLDPADAYNGVNGSSLSYFTFYTRGDADTSVRRRPSDRKCVDYRPPDYLLPGCKEQPLTRLLPLRESRKPLQCLRALTMSGWNPPPGNRKMHGDLLYLQVLTMEDRELNITSCTRGFYLNQSNKFHFNPKPALPKILCHTLVDLLNQLSPTFNKNFSTLQKERVRLHLYERIPTSFQHFTWIAPHRDHTLDLVRAEETHTSCMGQEEQTVGQSRDWNEELQVCRELPRSSLQERLHRERSLFKTNSDFVAAATKGAVAVVDGNVMPLNPGESPHSQMFLWNNIFFSLGFDALEHYKTQGGDTAAHAAARCDLRGAQAFALADIQGLHTLGTSVVDYRGFRVIAQTIVPGILEKSHDQCVVYGSNDNGKTVFTHPRFLELLEKASKPLRIQRHRVLDHNNIPVQLCSGIDTIGLLGNDGRPYILDLQQTLPPDQNFKFSMMEEDVPVECQRLGFPRQHPHSRACLRPELIEAFVQHRYQVFLNIVSEEANPLDETKDGLAGDKDCTDMVESQRIVVLRACEAVGSTTHSHFDIRFNPNVVCPGARLSECKLSVQKQKQLLWDAAAFVLSNQIPAVLQDCGNFKEMPMDGASLTSVLHQRGVNVRYIGVILQEIDRMEEKDRLSHIHGFDILHLIKFLSQRICLIEVITRSTKHIFKGFLQNVGPPAFSAAVSHFLNCLLSSSVRYPDSFSDELLSRRRSHRRRNHCGRVSTSPADRVWAQLTSNVLWEKIRAEAQHYFHYTIDSANMSRVIEKHNLQKISLLREFAMKTGIQLQLREYLFDCQAKPLFSEEDVVNMFPVVSHLKSPSTDAPWLVEQARAAVQQGLLKDGYDLISQALTLYTSVCGLLHEDVSMCLRLLGHLGYILGDNTQAFNHQEKVVMISERVQGIDNPQTIQDYMYLALYCFAGGQHPTSLQLLYRARYLTLLVSGEDHPQVAVLDSMLGLVLHGLMEYDLSLKFLMNTLALTCKYHGATSLKHAHSHHLLAGVYGSKGEFRSALQHEREAYTLYKDNVGENHGNTKESSQSLRLLTQQAVALQKTLNALNNNTSGASVPPLKFTPPSLPTILKQLNLTCGITVDPLGCFEKTLSS